MSTRNTSHPHVLMIPGAWMGSWIWEPTAAQLRDRGIDAATTTLAGLEAGTPDDRIAQVRLVDHVDQVIGLLNGGTADPAAPVILVGHSYSGMVAAQVADRLGDRVITCIHFDSFLPVDGRSLLDDWGPDEEIRARERADIIDARHLWAPPPAAGLDSETGLSPEQRGYLADRFTPHPGRTALDPASLRRPVETRQGVFVASSPANVPATLRTREAPGWRVHVLESGHWPMLERPDEVTALIADVVDTAVEEASGAPRGGRHGNEVGGGE